MDTRKNAEQLQLLQEFPVESLTSVELQLGTRGCNNCMKGDMEEYSESFKVCFLTMSIWIPFALAFCRPSTPSLPCI